MAIFNGWLFVHGDRDDHRYPISGPMQGIFRWRVKIQGTHRGSLGAAVPGGGGDETKWNMVKPIKIVFS